MAPQPYAVPSTKPRPCARNTTALPFTATVAGTQPRPLSSTAAHAHVSGRFAFRAAQ